MDIHSPLPGRKIDLGSTSYFVHGLVHDTPLVQISRDFKKAISDKLKDYNTICEDGFVDWIENSASFNEISYFRLNRFNFFDILKIFFILGHAKLNKRKRSLTIEKMQKMKTLEDFYSIREELFRNYNSEPEGMNSLLSKLGKGTLYNPKGEFPLRIKRYIYEAKESIKYVQNNNLKELHIVIGCAHEFPLEYLLKNPEILDRLNI